MQRVLQRLMAEDHVLHHVHRLVMVLLAQQRVQRRKMELQMGLQMGLLMGLIHILARRPNRRHRPFDAYVLCVSCYMRLEMVQQWSLESPPWKRSSSSCLRRGNQVAWGEPLRYLEE
jgi:hypothetical protein